MNKRYPHITTPLRVSGNLMKNRIILAPSTIHSANDGTLYPLEDSIAFFEQRARTGAAMVYAAGVKYCDVRDDGEHSNWDTRVHNHKHKLAHLAERIHFHGAKAGMEIIGFLPGIYTCSDGNCIMGSPPIGKEAPKEVLEQTKNDIADCCAALVECGFDGVLFHFGHSVPLAQFLSPLTNHRTDEYGGSLENRNRFMVETLYGIREAVGPHFDLILEAHRGMTAAEAVAFGNEVAKYRPMVLEDPMTPDNIDTMAQIAHKIPVPIATGERFVNLREFEMLMRRGAAQYVRPDVCAVGGITTTKKVCAAAEASDVLVIPHNPLGPVSTAACLQICACIPNLGIQELPDFCLNGSEDAMVKELLRFENGFMLIPEAPGIGVELAENAAELYPAKGRGSNAAKRAFDGSVKDW